MGKSAGLRAPLPTTSSVQIPLQNRKDRATYLTSIHNRITLRELIPRRWPLPRGFRQAVVQMRGPSSRRFGRFGGSFVVGSERVTG